MRASTVAALNRINRRFYDDQAEDFDHTRQGPWAGWGRVVDAVRESLPRGRPLTVLDVGCGNGRFGRFLAHALPDTEIRWAGLDASAPLLARADSIEGAPGLVEPVTRTWHLLGSQGEGPPALPCPTDLWPDLDALGPGAPGAFDLVVAFGVFHHVPGPLQGPLLRRMRAATRNGGLVIASFWQFAELEHYDARRIDWADAVAAGWLAERDVAELDADDWLLRWGADDELRARYCRATDEAAAHRALRASGEAPPSAEWFRADGRTGALNLYLTLEAG